MVKYILSLIATFVVACCGWYLILGGSAIIGGAIIGFCMFFAFWMSVHMVFGTVDNFIKEVSTW